MPDREKFREYFEREGAALQGSAHTQYRKLRWGNRGKETWDFKAPESMSALGYLTCVVIDGRAHKYPEKTAPFIGVGVLTNYLYIVPRVKGSPIDVVKGPYEQIGKVSRTEYVSRKGKEEALYYHDHERPYPTLCTHSSGACVIIPAKTRDGRRSYVVGPEGIIG